MPSFGATNDDDFNMDSPNASSDNDQDEQMDEADELEGDGDVEPEQEADADADADEDMDENEEDDDQDDAQEQSSDTPAKPTRTDSTATQGLPDSQPTKEQSKEDSVESNGKASIPGVANGFLRPNQRLAVRAEAISAGLYDIAPTIAAPHSTSINAITSTPDLKWVFTGGSDGYIRKFNWVDTVNGKVMLTVAQRHSFVDSVTKAGVLTSYWENEEPLMKSPSIQANDDGLSLSPVYSLAAHSQGLWLLSGLESGGINLQSVRHDEGKRITCLKKHTSAVSVLSLAPDERSLLSGSWDKYIYDWDLDTGTVKRDFSGSGGQISAIEPRPYSELSVPAIDDSEKSTNGTFTTNDAVRSSPSNGNVNSIPQNELGSLPDAANLADDGPESPTDSLFGDKDGDSLFGDNDGTPRLQMDSPSDGTFDYGNDISRAIETETRQQDNSKSQKIDAFGESTADSSSDVKEVQKISTIDSTNQSTTGKANDLSNGIEADTKSGIIPNERPTRSEPAKSGVSQKSETTFVAASFNGSLRLWDRRQSAPVATITPPRSVPPWCMNVCWSPDGNFIYAGRRNGTVEEYNLHKGLRQAERTFKFPLGSGPVSAVRAMPNGRHLICASFDILRLYDLKDEQTTKHSTVPFLIIPGHRGGVISSLHIDPTCSYLLSSAGNRGWEGSTTEVLLGYEISVTN